MLALAVLPTSETLEAITPSVPKYSFALSHEPLPLICSCYSNPVSHLTPSDMMPPTYTHTLINVEKLLPSSPRWQAPCSFHFFAGLSKQIFMVLFIWNRMIINSELKLCWWWFHVRISYWSIFTSRVLSSKNVWNDSIEAPAWPWAALRPVVSVIALTYKIRAKHFHVSSSSQASTARKRIETKTIWPSKYGTVNFIIGQNSK